MEKKPDKRGHIDKELNPEQMDCYIHIKPYPLFLWTRMKLVSIKLMFFSNCIKGPKIFYLYQNS